jgi:hypothetical protein
MEYRINHVGYCGTEYPITDDEGKTTLKLEHSDYPLRGGATTILCAIQVKVVSKTRTVPVNMVGAALIWLRRSALCNLFSPI